MDRERQYCTASDLTTVPMTYASVSDPAVLAALDIAAYTKWFSRQLMPRPYKQPAWRPGKD